MNELRTYEGGCHCQRVRFRVTANLDTVIICNCSICTKKGIVHLIVPSERFELLCGKDDLMTYTFNTGVAKHTFCKHCGIHSFYVPRWIQTRSTTTRAALMILTSRRCSRNLLTANTGSDSLQQRVHPGANEDSRPVTKT
jgi:hypothetical protein